MEDEILKVQATQENFQNELEKLVSKNQDLENKNRQLENKVNDLEGMLQCPAGWESSVCACPAGMQDRVRINGNVSNFT